MNSLIQCRIEKTSTVPKIPTKSDSRISVGSDRQYATKLFRLTVDNYYTLLRHNSLSIFNYLFVDFGSGQAFRPFDDERRNEFENDFVKIPFRHEIAIRRWNTWKLAQPNVYVELEKKVQNTCHFEILPTHLPPHPTPPKRWQCVFRAKKWWN